MFNKFKALSLFLAVVFLSLLPAGRAHCKVSGCITVLHTNDNHGQFWPDSYGQRGMPILATMIDEIRKEAKMKGCGFLLLSAGDVNSGTPESDLNDARPMFLAMKYIGYDAMTVGNHEFDKEFEVLIKQQRWAGFPFLSANIFYKGSKRRPFKPYLVKNLGRMKAAIFGLTYENTPVTSTRFPKKLLELRNYSEVTESFIGRLKKESDILIALTHIGLNEKIDPDHDYGGDMALAQKFAQIDIIVGGHSHSELSEPIVIGDTIIVQAGSDGRYLGRLDIEIIDGKKKLQKNSLMPVAGIKPDMKLESKLKPYVEGSERIRSEFVAESRVFLDGNRDLVRRGQSPIGKFLTHILKETTDADLAILNSGGIRAGLPKGRINYGHLLSVNPFESTYATVKLSGKELMRYLDEVSQKPAGSGAYPQTAGIKIEMDPVTQRIKNALIQSKEGFSPIDENKFYLLAVNSFIANGGDGYPILNDKKTYTDLRIREAAAVRNFLKKTGIINGDGDRKPDGE